MKIIKISTACIPSTSNTSQKTMNEQYKSPNGSQLISCNHTMMQTTFNSRPVLRRIQDIDEHSFKTLSENMKKFLRKKCENFNNSINVNELAAPKLKYLPLMKQEDIETFVQYCKNFNQLKDSHIICLGRSPKWFLNTSLWMKDGIEDYKFVAFSGAWYRKGPWKLLREEKKVPTQEELTAYKKYLKKIQADPVSFIKKAQDTGKQVVITDYICTGKGMTSFLEVMSDYADEQGVLDEFGKSFRIHGFGSREFLEQIFYDQDEIENPVVQLPIKLAQYREAIEQKYYNIPYNIFMQMLENSNTNECRATYYPHEAWTIYNPDKYKTGMIPESIMEKLKIHSPKTTVNFTPTMRDYRNLLNFRILDYLEQNKLLK